LKDILDKLLILRLFQIFLTSLPVVLLIEMSVGSFPTAGAARDRWEGSERDQQADKLVGEVQMYDVPSSQQHR